MWELLGALLPGGSTLWTIDVWNCRGTFKPTHLGLGCGCKPDLPPGWRWYDLGWFTMPLPDDVELRDEQKEKIEKILWDAIERAGGAINISGWYNVFQPELDRIAETLGSELASRYNELFAFE